MTATAPSLPSASYLRDAGALEEGLRLGEAGVWRWKIDTEQLEWTANLELVHGLAAGSFDHTLSSFRRDLHPDDASEVWHKIKTSIETGEPYRAVYRTAPRPEQPEVWIETSGGVTTDAEGNRYLTGICLDVSARVRSEQELARVLSQQQAVARFGSFALGETDFQKILDEAVQLASSVLRAPLTKILQFADGADHLVLKAGIGWADGLLGRAAVGIDRESQAGYTLLSSGPVIVRDLPLETRFSGPQLLHDHGVRSGISVVIPGTDARPFGVFGIHTRERREFDETDAGFLQSLANIVAGAARQVASAEHQKLLVREMAHRAGNMLQLVNSIANQTFHAQADPDVAIRSFSQRLGALARSNYVVARGGWTATRFRALVEETFSAFENRVAATGRDVLLPPELSFDLGLVLHELLTNSVKYGTLGRDAGEIAIRWAFRPQPDGTRRFWCEWTDDAPVAQSSGAAAGHSGFGSKLIRALVEHKWAGVVSYQETPHFVATLEVPVPLSAATR